MAVLLTFTFHYRTYSVILILHFKRHDRAYKIYASGNTVSAIDNAQTSQHGRQFVAYDVLCD